MRTRSIGIDEIPDRARNISDIFINPFSILIVHHNQVLIFPTLAFFFTIFKWLNNDKCVMFRVWLVLKLLTFDSNQSQTDKDDHLPAHTVRVLATHSAVTSVTCS